MKSKPATFASFLRRIADIIEPLSESEFENFFTKLSSLAKQPVKPRSGGSKKSQPPLDAIAVVNQLQQSTSREEGVAVLAKLNLSRDELVAVANVRSIYVAKEDKIGRVREKLIESIIGSRLSSRAIRGDESTP